MTTQALQPVRSREEWAQIINADWRKSIEGIIQTGRDLISAKDELPEGSFVKMIEADLPFGRRTASRLMSIARNPAISNGTARSHLPHSWRVLSELANLSEDDFADATEKGLIHENLSGHGAIAVRRAYEDESGKAIGAGKSLSQLPTPKEAREVARATNRLVAASDGNLYSGSTDEEGADYVRRREQTFGVIDAITALADCPVDPETWCAQAKNHWLHKFRFGSIEDAIAWLAGLRATIAAREGIIDGE